MTILNNTDCSISRNTPNYIYKHFNGGLPDARIYFSKSKKTFYLTTTSNDSKLTNYGWEKQGTIYVMSVYRGNRS
jgi:hypothetical protein